MAATDTAGVNLNKDKIDDPEEKITEIVIRGMKFSTSRVTSRKANPLFLLLRLLISYITIAKHCMVLILLMHAVKAYSPQKFAIEPQDQVSYVERVPLHNSGENTICKLSYICRYTYTIEEV